MGNTAHSISVGKRAKFFEQLGVGSGETTLLFSARTAGNTSQSTLRNVSASRAQFLPALCRKQNKNHFKKQETHPPS